MGSNTYGQLGVGDKKLELKSTPILVERIVNKKIQAVSCGQFHTIILTVEGEAYAWGSNKFGQCGINLKAIAFHEPKKVDFEEYYFPYLRQINAGGNHSGFIDDVGRLFMCGKNDFGQLGLDQFVNQQKPVVVGEVERHSMREVACGDEHTLILDKKGKVYVMGSNIYG